MMPMRRSPLVLFLFLLALSAAQAGGQALHLGQFDAVVQKVFGRLFDAPEEPKKKADPVVDNLWVMTKKASGARIALGGAKAQGTVTIGPESQFQFEEAVLNAAGNVDKLNFRISWGKLLFRFIPRRKNQPVLKDLGVEPNEVKIKAPNGVEIQLYGTELYVFVDRETGATSVYVTEGKVAVRRGGVEVSVRAGQWSYVSPDGAPSLPAPFVIPGGSVLPVNRHDSILSSIVDPFLNTQDPLLDLPK